MSALFTIHDDARALVRSQRSMRRVLIAFGTVSVGMVLLAPVLAVVFGGAGWVPATACGLLCLHAGATIRRMARLRRRLWRVAVSPRHLVTLDVARRQTTVAWVALRRVAFEADGMYLTTRTLSDNVLHFHVPESFEGYVGLAHDVVDLATRRRVPIWVNGRPVDELDLAPWQRLLDQDRVLRES